MITQASWPDRLSIMPLRARGTVRSCHLVKIGSSSVKASPPCLPENLLLGIESRAFGICKEGALPLNEIKAHRLSISASTNYLGALVALSRLRTSVRAMQPVQSLWALPPPLGRPEAPLDFSQIMKALLTPLLKKS